MFVWCVYIVLFLYSVFNFYFYLLLFFTSTASSTTSFTTHATILSTRTTTKRRKEEEKKKNKTKETFLFKVSELTTKNGVVCCLFCSFKFILLAGVLLLVCCVHKCRNDRAAEVEVRQDNPNNFVVLLDVPNWVTSPRLLLHHYHMQSM